MLEIYLKHAQWGMPRNLDDWLATVSLILLLAFAYAFHNHMEQINNGKG